MNIGKTVAELRADANMSQQALADALFVSRDLVSKWENGARRPDYKTIEKIAAVFGVSPDLFIDKDDLLFSELESCLPRGADLPDEKLTELLTAFLKGLRNREADVFVKRYYLLRSVETISKENGIKENHVRSILSKTRKKLKKYLEERTR